MVSLPGRGQTYILALENPLRRRAWETIIHHLPLSLPKAIAWTASPYSSLLVCVLR